VPGDSDAERILAPRAAPSIEAANRRYSAELKRAGAPLERARVLSDWGDALRAGGKPAEARSALEDALEIAGEPLPRSFFGLRRAGPEAPPPPAPAAAAPGEAARLELAHETLERLAAACAAAGDAARAAAAGRKALAVAARLGPGPRYARTLGAQGLALAARGERDQAALHLEPLERLAAASEEGAPLAGAIAARFAALVLLELGRFAEARRAAEAARRLAERAGDPAARLEATLAAARAAAAFGLAREAAALAEDARRAARELGLGAAEDEADIVSGLALALSGEVARGRRRIERARARTLEAPDGALAREASLAAGTLALLDGQWRTARDGARELGTRPGRSWSLLAPALLYAEACLAAIHARAGRRVPLSEAVALRDEAADVIARVLAAAEGSPGPTARARRIAGALAAEGGDPGAIAVLERALAEARAAAGPVETAQALVTLAIHAARVDSRDPLPLYHEASRLAREAGADALASRVHALVDAAERARVGRNVGSGTGIAGGRESRGLASLLEVGRAVSSILDLDPLLGRILDEIVRLVGADRGFVMLYDEPRALAGAAPAGAGELRVRVARNLDRRALSSAELQVSRSVVAEVERTRGPVLVADALNDSRFGSSMSVADLQLRSIICLPLKTMRSFLGVAYVDSRSPTDLFYEGDVELGLPFVAQAAIAIENAFAYRKIRDLYEETLGIARTREKVLAHIAHELQTPVAVVEGALVHLASGKADPAAAARTADRARRNLQRLKDIRDTVGEILGGGAAAPELPVRLDAGALLEDALARARAAAPGRAVEIAVEAPADLAVAAPRRPIERALDALLKNAIEATPDEGRIELAAAADGAGAVALVVRDLGVGIPEEGRRHVFDGFYHVQPTEHYSSKRPYEFGAGGKGLELVRLKAAAARHGWRVALASERCKFIPAAADACPGRISACPHCRARGDCLGSGGTSFTLVLPAAR
jgi:signal transduction histidine kinase